MSGVTEAASMMSSSRGGGISQVLAFSFHDVDSFSNSVDSSSGAASDLAAMDWVYLSATSISASDSSSLASDWLHPFVNYLLYGLAMSQSDLPALENIINTKRTLSLTAISGLVTAAFSTSSLNGSLKFKVKLLRNHCPRLEMQARDVKKDTLQLDNGTELTKRLFDSW